MATTTIDPNYGYVLLAAASTFVLNSVHSLNTGYYRKVAKIPYPAAYAPSSRTDIEAHRFNCAQRAHANYIEHQPSVLAMLLLGGIRFPISAAVLGVAWSLSRWVYMRGYSEGGKNGNGRYKGISFWFWQSGLLGLTVWSAVQMILGK